MRSLSGQQRFTNALQLKEDRRFAEAQLILEQLASERPDSAAVWAVLGDVYWEQQMLDQAVGAFRIAVTQAPTSEVASLGLFHTLWENGERDAALAEARQFQQVASSADYRYIFAEMEATDRDFSRGGTV